MEEGMATHSSILAWRIPWREEPGGLQSLGLHRVGHDWSNLAHMPTCCFQTHFMRWVLPWYKNQTRHDYKRKLQANIPGKHRCKNQQNISNWVSIKRVIFSDWVGFLPGIPKWFNICKVNLRRHINKTKEKSYNHLDSVQFSCSVMSDSLRPHESQHATPPCPSPTPGVYSNSCPSSRWCHTTILSSVIPFFSCPQSLPASGSFPMSPLFAWGGQSIGVSASASVLPMNTQGWCPLGWTGWISLQSKGLSRVFSNTTVQKHQFFVISIAV